MKNKRAVSAVIGVILMTAITVAIAATVYVYVTGLYEVEDHPELSVEGTVTSVVNYTWSAVYKTTVYNITLDDEDTYQMLFRSDDALVPPTNVELRFYYNIVMKNGSEDYYDVYEIKSL